jgi:uncharacterized protein (DUF2236 family)
MATVLPDPEEVADLVPVPGSIAWRAAGDTRVLGAAAYALLLQVSHPVVGAGVAEHSNFKGDPWGRLLRTLDYVNGTIYGGPEVAGEIGRRVRGMHKEIKGVRPDGTRYHALEPGAYAWVHATLAASIVDGHRHLGRPMRWSEQREFYAQWRRLGRIVGVRDRDLPERWEDFRPYFDGVVHDVLEDTESVHDVFDTLARPTPPPGMPPPVWRALRGPLGRQVQTITTGLLPPVLRERFGLPWSPRHARTFAALTTMSRASRPVIRGPLRELGPSYIRWRGLA